MAPKWVPSTTDIRGKAQKSSSLTSPNCRVYGWGSDVVAFPAMLDTVDPVWLIPEEAGEYTSRSPDEEGLYYVGEWVIQCGVTPSEFEFCNYSAPAKDPDPAWFTYTWTCKARKLHEHPHISCIEERWVDTHAIVQVYRKRKVL